MSNKKLLFDVYFDGKLLGRVLEEDRHDLINEHLLDQGILPKDIKPGTIEHKLVKVLHDE
jgi:hypothetical protein